MTKPQKVGFFDIVIPAVPRGFGGQGTRFPFNKYEYARLSLAEQCKVIARNCDHVGNGLVNRTMYASEAASNLELVAKMLKSTMEELALHYSD